MIRIFYGNDRQKAQSAIDKILGDDYEIIEAENIERADMDSIFRGTSLFGETRNILLKNLNENKSCWESFPNYLDTTHKVIIWLLTLDRRSAVYKKIEKNKSIEFKEFKLAEKVNQFLAFDIAKEAFAGRGTKAVKMCEEAEITDDPYLMMGAIASYATKMLSAGNAKAVRAIKILAKADIDMKSANVDAWSVLKIALLKIGSR